MRFALAALLFMYVGRRIGRALSRNFLYQAPIVISLVVAVAWGVGTGIAMSGLIGWLRPNVLAEMDTRVCSRCLCVDSELRPYRGVNDPGERTPAS